MPFPQPGSSEAACRRRRGLGLSALGVTLALLAVGPGPASGQPSEASGGYWRSADAEGHYRVRILAADAGPRVQIDWISRSPGGEEVVASVTLSDLGEGGPWQLVNPELRTEGQHSVLELSAHDPRSDARRVLSVELSGPGVYRRR